MLELDEKRRDVFENLKSIPRTTDTVSAIAALYPHLDDESTKRAAESYLFCECVGASFSTTGKKDETSAASRVGACLRSGMTSLSDDAVRNLLSHHADFELFAALTGSYFVDGKGYASMTLSDVAKRKMVEYASKRIDGISRSSETTEFLRNAFVLLENICSRESANFDTEAFAIFVSRIVEAMRNASERSLRAVDEMRNFLKRSEGNASILPFVEQLVQESLKVGIFSADAALAAVKSPETILACLEETDRLVEAGRLSFGETRDVLLLGKKFLGEKRFERLFDKSLEHAEKTMPRMDGELVLDFAYACVASFEMSSDEVSKLVRLLEKTPAKTPKWYAPGTENFATGVDEMLFVASTSIERKNFEHPKIVYGNTAKIVSASGRYFLDDKFLDILMRDRTNHYSRLGTKEQKQNLAVANAKLLMISALHGDDETSARAMEILKKRSSKSSSFAACVRTIAEQTLRKELYRDASRFLILGKDFFGPRRKMSTNFETWEKLFRMMKRHVEEGDDDKAERAFACFDFLRSCISGFSSKEKNFEETLEPTIKELFLSFADEASRAFAGTENRFEEECESEVESAPVL